VTGHVGRATSGVSELPISSSWEGSSAAA
jgi:hypothetical protein